jgi:phosphoinositide 3-/4-kinase-like protein
MKAVQRAALLCVLTFTWMAGSSSLLAIQETAAVARPALTPEQIEDFLLNARIIATKGVSKGITNTRRATLSDGRITHDAQIQTVDLARPVFTPDRGPTQLNFRDTYRYNIAGYRLAVLLGLDNVPMSVSRRVQGSEAAVTWWVDDVLMDEGQRRKKPAVGWVATRTAEQIHIMRVFDALIANTDRNAGNLLWTTDGKMWMIDHTRAFRLNTKPTTPELLERCDRRLLEAMRELTAETLKAAIDNNLNKLEIDTLLARRNEIVKHFEAKIAQRGEAAVLYAIAQR